MTLLSLTYGLPTTNLAAKREKQADRDAAYIAAANPQVVLGLLERLEKLDAVADAAASGHRRGKWRESDDQGTGFRAYWVKAGALIAAVCTRRGSTCGGRIFTLRNRCKTLLGT